MFALIRADKQAISLLPEVFIGKERKSSNSNSKSVEKGANIICCKKPEVERSIEMSQNWNLLF